MSYDNNPTLGERVALIQASQGMKLIVQSPQGPIFEPQDVFEACIKAGKLTPKQLETAMYMHSKDEHTHIFKCSVTRKYWGVVL